MTTNHNNQGSYTKAGAFAELVIEVTHIIAAAQLRARLEAAQDLAAGCPPRNPSLNKPQPREGAEYARNN